MAILAIFKGEGFTKEMYENLRQEVDWEHKNPAGAIFHAAGFDENGNAHVADIWESQEALDEFFKSRLVPAFRKLDIPAPKAEVFPAYNVFAYPQIDQYKA
jgi:hypothetical protein